MNPLLSVVLFVLSSALLLDNVQGVEFEAIVGGDESKLGAHQYQVSIQHKGQNLCGGAIIGEEHILTAAHCVVEPTGEFREIQPTILAGVHSLKESGVKVSVEKVYVPKTYVPDNQNALRRQPYRAEGDIAILKLSKKLKLGANNHVDKVQLPAHVEEYEKLDPDHNEFVVAGFGIDKVKIQLDPKTQQFVRTHAEASGKLKFARTDIVKHNYCQIAHEDPLHSTHLCAKTRQRDRLNPEGVCSGDSGSPLVLNGKTVVGVLNSQDVRCNENFGPAVYTRVDAFTTFIANAIANKNLADIRVAVVKNQKHCFSLGGKSCAKLVEVK